eukprot:gene5207-18435_t
MEPRKSCQTRSASKKTAASKLLSDASWILGQIGPLLPAFLDVKGRQSLRLACKQLREDVEASTRCLTLVCSEKQELLDLSDHRILHKCLHLERLAININNDIGVLVLDGLPGKLQALEVKVLMPALVNPAVFLGPLPGLRSLKELSLSDPGAMEPRKSYQTRSASKKTAASKLLSDASWILGQIGPLLPAFLDVKGRQSLRLACKQLREDVEASTRCLTLVCSEKEELLDLSDHRILHKCRHLERLAIYIDNDIDVLVLDGLPGKLQALEVKVLRPALVNPAVFLGPLPGLRSLKELSLSGIHRLTQAALIPGPATDPL